jgi:hypothetical protein
MSAVQTQYNMTDVWSVMENQMKLGFLTILTVDLDLDFEMETPLVLEGAITIDQIMNEPVEAETIEKDVVTSREDGVDHENDSLVPDIRIVHRGKEEPSDD